MKGAPWTRGELITVLKLYCLTPFGRIHSRNPEIVSAAEALGRTASAIALKMTNFASLDPTIQRSGMGNVSKLDKEVWTDFFNDMDSFLGAQNELPGEDGVVESSEEFSETNRLGLDVLRMTKTRINQSFFRNLILASYDNRCAITGIDTPTLLVASHIVPWSINATSGTDPQNGICLNSLHDRAFDCGLITFDEDLLILFSPRMPAATKDAIMSFGQKKLRLPNRFVPSSEFLAYHRSDVFLAT